MFGQRHERLEIAPDSIAMLSLDLKPKVRLPTGGLIESLAEKLSRSYADCISMLEFSRAHQVGIVTQLSHPARRGPNSSILLSWGKEQPNRQERD